MNRPSTRRHVQHKELRDIPHRAFTRLKTGYPQRKILSPNGFSFFLGARRCLMAIMQMQGNFQGLNHAHRFNLSHTPNLVNQLLLSQNSRLISGRHLAEFRVLDRPRVADAVSRNTQRLR
jgi:hypothetical protein